MTREDYIHYRLNRAYEAFDDAKLLAENERWNTAVNRLYYASFYAIIALLIKMVLRHKLMMELELNSG